MVSPPTRPMNIKKIKIPCETIPRCGVNPRDSPTVAMAEVVSNRHSDSGKPSTVLMVNAPVSERTRYSVKMAAASWTAFSSIRRPNISGLFCLRNTAKALATSTAIVVVLMPPAVEPGEPPMNISRIVRPRPLLDKDV